MINDESVQQLQREPVADRLRLMELLLKSIERDLRISDPQARHPSAPFKIREFCLGENVSVDRADIYGERGL